MGRSTCEASEAHNSCFATTSNTSQLITLELFSQGNDISLRALLDSGASSNFMRQKTLEHSFLKFEERKLPPSRLNVRLANGKIVSTRKRVVNVHYTLDGLPLEDEFIVLDMDDKFDVILGMPWLTTHRPVVDWTRRTVQLQEEDPGKDAPDLEEHGNPHDARALVAEGACRAQPLCTAAKAGTNEVPAEANARVSSKSTVSSHSGGTRCETSHQTKGAQPWTDARPHQESGVVRAARRQGITIEEELQTSSNEFRSPAAATGRSSTSGTDRSEGDTAEVSTPQHSTEMTAVPTHERAAEDATARRRQIANTETLSTETEVVPLAGPSQQGSGRDQGCNAPNECVANAAAGGRSILDTPASGDLQQTRTTAWTCKQSCNTEPEQRLEGHVQRETLNVMVNDGARIGASILTLETPPKEASELVKLPELDQKHFLRELRRGKIAQLCIITPLEEHTDLRAALASTEVDIRSSSTMDESVLGEHEQTRIERYEAQSWDALKGNPVYDILWEFKDVFPDEIPCELPMDRGIRHEIVLKPGTKYCVTRQWPLPRDQVKAIDEFFEARRRAGHVRESVSPHSSPTFCVKKATGGWRIVHAFNKLNAATVPAQTPIPRKDVIIDGMQGSTIFSALDLRDGYYQILMREEDVPLTAVSTPSGMLWEWLVMPQGLSNAPATFNRCVTHLLRPVREFAPSYFDDVFVHSKAEDGKTDVEMHRIHVRKLLELMRKYKLYANLKKCIFAAPEIPVLGSFVSKDGVRPDPEKIRAIKDWPTPMNAKELRQFLGMATYLHKYSRGFAQRALPLTALLKKEAEWRWNDEEQQSFQSIKESLIEAPILAIADQDKPFHVVCDASDRAIGCALMQKDDDGHERVISYESRQLKSAERNYPVHDRELLAMKYALVKYRIYLLGDRPFTVFTDHASLRTAINSPHLSQRMARWLSFFAEYNFHVEYKPGRLNVVADALSRRPRTGSTSEEASTDVRHASVVTAPSSSLADDVRKAYKRDKSLSALVDFLAAPDTQPDAKLSPLQRASLHRFKLDDGLLWYRAVADDDYAIVVPNDYELKLKILFEYHDAPVSGHRGREKTFAALRRDFYWKTSISLYGSTYKLVRFVSDPSSRLDRMRHCSLCPLRQTAGSPSRWTSSSVYPKTRTEETVSLSSLIDSARWCILLPYLRPSRPQVPHASSWRTCSVSMECLMR